MAFSSRPDRLKVNQSPAAAKKSPGSTSGTGVRKCSSPVFTSSPSRPSAKAPLRSLLKSPEHHHHKENGHLGNSQRPLTKTSTRPTRPTATASPKKVFGEHNDTAMHPRRLRKEWQIPSPSALELKESLSGMSDAGGAVDKSASFTVNSGMLSEPEPVSGWIQTREQTVNSERKKDLFEAKVHAPHSPTRSEHSYAGSSTVETTHEEELTSELRDGSLVSESFSVRLDKESIVVSEAQEETPVALEVKVEKHESSLLAEGSEEEKPSVVSEVVQVEQAIVHEEVVKMVEAVTPKSKKRVKAKSQKSSFRRKKWSLALGLLFLISFITLLVTAPGQAKLSGATSFMHRLSSGIDWSSDSETVGFYVDPGRLRTDVLKVKVYFHEVHGKWNNLVLEKASRYKRQVERMGVRSIEVFGSYYSSLVLQNHAKDLLFNYCDKFQGQYHQLRVALVFLIEQIRPLEATARATLMRLNLDESMSKVEEWVRSAERFAYKALVRDYLHLPAEEHGPANFEQEDVNTGATDQVLDSEEDSESLHIGSRDLDDAIVSVVSNESVLAETSSGFQDEAPAADNEVLPSENDVDSMIQEDPLVLAHHPVSVEEVRAETAPGFEENALEADIEMLPSDNDAVSMIQEDEAAPAETVEAIEGLTEVSEILLLGGDATTAAVKLISHAKLYATVSASAVLALTAVYVSYQLFFSGSKAVALGAAPSKTKRARKEPLTPCTPEPLRGAREEFILSPEQQAADYSPYGSFTAYKRVVLNEGTENEEVKLTPVRRSGRIRNQLFQSPQLK